MAKRGENIYKRKDNRWEGRYIIGRKPTGQTKYASVYGRSYTEVKEKLARKKGDRLRSLPSCGMTIGAIMEMWLSLRSADVKESSYQRYRMLIEKHILPRLGGLRLNTMTAKILSDFVSALLKKGRTDGRGGLSVKTVSDILCIFRSALRLAGRNYAVDVSLFAVKTPTVRTKPVETFSEAECSVLTRRVLDAPDLSGAAYLLSLNCGLRIGEICGLKWQDIDFAKRELAVNRTVLRIKADRKTKVVVQTPKTESSVRVIPLTAQMLSLLSRLRNTDCEDTFILSGSGIKPLEPRALQYRFKVFQKRIGLKHRNYHILRHTFASRSIGKGFDVKTLSELLGHKDIRTTMQLYMHPTMLDKRRVIEAVSSMLPLAV
ncbi:MAG: site-specific integrase [Clostridia bacterium]|nr:site-specific integrase [Clostridia bacterium]